MAKTNTYKLKNGVSREDLKRLGFKDGSWQKQYENIECVSKRVNLCRDIEMHIVIETNPMGFDDFDDILILDEEFCQPYTPFYGENYKEEVNNFQFLEKIIEGYNVVMDEIGVFGRIDQ